MTSFWPSNIRFEWDSVIHLCVYCACILTHPRYATLQEAMRHYLRSLALDATGPVAASCHSNLGTCFYQLVRIPCRPCLCLCLFLSHATLRVQKRLPHALKQFNRALELRPDFESGERVLHHGLCSLVVLSGAVTMLQSWRSGPGCSLRPNVLWKPSMVRHVCESERLCVLLFTHSGRCSTDLTRLKQLNPDHTTASKLLRQARKGLRSSAAAKPAASQTPSVQLPAPPAALPGTRGADNPPTVPPTVPPTAPSQPTSKKKKRRKKKKKKKNTGASQSHQEPSSTNQEHPSTPQESTVNGDDEAVPPGSPEDGPTVRAGHVVKVEFNGGPATPRFHPAVETAHDGAVAKVDGTSESIDQTSSSAGDKPCAATQRTTVERLWQQSRDAGLLVGQRVFVLDGEWLREWAGAAGFHDAAAADEQALQALRPISNSRLLTLDAAGQETLVPGLKLDTDVFIVPEGVWTALVTWYVCCGWSGTCCGFVCLTDGPAPFWFAPPLPPHRHGGGPAIERRATLLGGEPRTSLYDAAGTGADVDAPNAPVIESAQQVTSPSVDAAAGEPAVEAQRPVAVQHNANPETPANPVVTSEVAVDAGNVHDSTTPQTKQQKKKKKKKKKSDHFCWTCGEHGASLRCARCRTVYYCSRPCQVRFNSIACGWFVASGSHPVRGFVDAWSTHTHSVHTGRCTRLGAPVTRTLSGMA